VVNDSLKIATIGLGRMGAAMAHRFAADGHRLVAWNRDRAKADAVAASTGASVAPTPSDAVVGVDVVISSLADDAALRSVYLGDDGVVAGLAQGVVVADTSTVDPSSVLEVGIAVDGAGASFMDCPVSGSVATVESGMLTVMAGGDASALPVLERVFGSVAKRVIHVGPRGAGAATTLAVNGLVHGLNVSLAEALVLAERAGVDRSTAYEVFASGAAGAPFVLYKREAYEHPDDAQVAFTLDLVAKDLELITGLAERVGAPMAQAATDLDIVRRAIASGLGSHDMSAVAVYLRERDS
jgi:3-hydroxyisobutyrate dehydrogenase-like beta-hydroxyacid dehydrogenase